MFDLTKQS